MQLKVLYAVIGLLVLGCSGYASENTQNSPQSTQKVGIPDATKLWPTYRHDNTLAGISPIVGGLSTAPDNLWSVNLNAPLVAKENWSILDYNGDNNYELLRIVPEENKVICQNLLGQTIWEVNDMPNAIFYDCRDYAGNGGRGILFRCFTGTQYKWYIVDGTTGNRALLYVSHDFYGDDRRIGHILPDVQGQQICAWWDGDDNPVSPHYPNRVFEGYIWSFENGVANPNKRFFVNGLGEEVWVPLCLFTDIDKDGQTETVMISYQEARIYDTKTSAKKAQMHWYEGNAGSGIRDRKANIAVLPLRPGEYPSFLIVNPFIPGVMVVTQDGSSAKVLWKKVIGSVESQYQSAIKVGPGAPDPFIDLDGDGQIEIITAITNEHNDDKTYLVIFSANTGERLYEKPDERIINAEDLNKDGRLEIFIKSGAISPAPGAWAADGVGNEIPEVKEGDTLHISHFVKANADNIYKFDDIVKFASGKKTTAEQSDKPRITAGWIEPGAFSGYTFQQPIRQQDVRERIDKMAELGMDTIIIAYTELAGFYYPSAISFYEYDNKITIGPGQAHLKDFDVIDIILSQAEKNNMKVFVGLSRAGDMNLILDIFADKADEQRIQNNIDINKQIADELWRMYSKYKSFVGWYIAHEVSELNKTAKLVEPIAQHLKAIAPNTRILLAPNIDNLFTADDIRKSSIDILSYQDGVGPGNVINDQGIGYYSYNPQLTLPRLEKKWQEVFEMNRTTNKEIWGGMDIWEMDGKCDCPNHYGCPYSPSFSRVKQQMDLAYKYVNKISGYSFVEFMSDPNYANPLKSMYGFPDTDKKAHALFADYKKYLTSDDIVNPMLKPQPPEYDLQRSFGNVVTYANPVIWRTTPDSNDFLMKFDGMIWSCRLSNGKFIKNKIITVHQALGNNPPPPSPAQTYAVQGNTFITYVNGQEVYRQDRPMWLSWQAPPPIVGELGGKVRIITRSYDGAVLSISADGNDKLTLLKHSPAYKSSVHVYNNHLILSDINGDGSNELVTTIMDGTQPKVVAVDANGNIKLTISPLPNYTDLVLVAVGSLGTDSGQWIAIRCDRLNDTTAIAAYNGKTATQMWVRQSFGIDAGIKKSFTASIPTSTYDYNTDGADDLLVISDHFYGIIDVKNNIDLVPPADNPFFSSVVPGHWTAYGVPMLAKLFDTAQPQIVVGSSWSMLWTVDMSGNPIWHWRLSRDTDTLDRGREGLADLNGDGKIEVVMAQQDGTLRAFGAEPKSPYEKCPKCLPNETLGKTNRSASPLWQYRLKPPVSDFAAADIDADSNMELLCGARDGLYALKQSGGDCKVLWKKDLGRSVGSPVLADINNDGRPEILVTTADGYIHCLGKQSN